jgi:pilus assembly protein CpaE
MLVNSDQLLSVRRPLGAAAPELAAPLENRPRIVAFVGDDATEAALRAGLAGVAEELVIKRGNVRHAVRFFEKAPHAQAVLVDTTGTDDPIGGLEDLARVCPPDVLVTAIGDNTEIRFYRLLVQELGVAEYLPKPLTRDTVQTVLQPLFLGTGVSPSITRGGHLVAVCGAQGGAGATTIAVNFALHLAETTKGSIALLDLHLQDGAVASRLGVRPGAGLRVALEDPARADALFLERTALVLDQRLRLIAADEALDADLRITENGVRHVIALMRQKFNFIVVDVPMPLPQVMHPVIELARQVAVVLEPDVVGLRNACAIRDLVNEISGANRVFTVLNRFDSKGGLALRTVQKAFGAAPDMVIPDLGKRMVEAANLGVPALRRAPALRRHLAPLLREVAGVRAGRSRSRLSRWWRP